MSWMDQLNLRIDEKLVATWLGTREIIREEVQVAFEAEKNQSGKGVAVNQKLEGLLVLTNQRLLFLEGQGLDGKRLCEAVKVSLIDVDKVWFQKAPIKNVEEVKGLETHVFSLKKVGKKKEFKEFKKLLEEYCQKRKQQLEDETKKVVRFKIS
jgi:hypothetical protein